MNAAAKEKQRIQKLKDEKQTAFFDSATRRNVALELKTKSEMKQINQAIESVINTKKGALSSFIVKYWKPDNKRIINVPYSKMETLRMIHIMTENDPKRRGMMILLSMMESEATVDNLETGLKMAFYEEAQQ